MINVIANHPATSAHQQAIGRPVVLRQRKHESPEFSVHSNWAVGSRFAVQYSATQPGLSHENHLRFAGGKHIIHRRTISRLSIKWSRPLDLMQ